MKRYLLLILFTAMTAVTDGIVPYFSIQFVYNNFDVFFCILKYTIYHKQVLY